MLFNANRGSDLWFRAEKRNKHARALAVRQAPKKVTSFVWLLTPCNIPGKQQHFNLTNGMLVYCFHGEKIFRTKLT